MPTGYTFIRDQGWVKKQTEQEANYDNLGDGWPYLIALMRFFPDFTADIFQSENAEFDLTFTHRMLLRINAQYKDVAITGHRGLGKSFITDLGEMIDGELWPGTQTAIIAPTKKQGVKIESKIFKQIENNYKALTQLYKVDSNSVTGGSFIISTEYGSVITIGSFRGDTLHKAIAEETAQEDVGESFDSESFKALVPTLRGTYKIKRKQSPAYIANKIHSITSAGRRQNYAYELREKCRRNILLGKSAFIIDIPFSVALLEQMRPVAWAESIRDELTADLWLREMESVYSGNDKNPIVSDEVLSASRDLLCMEEHTILKDMDSKDKIKPQDVLYVLGYDVAYADGRANAKCACVVVKLTKQLHDWARKDKYRKDVVWIEDWVPAETPTPREQAKRLKMIWKRYCYNGSNALIAIDSWQYGTAVVQSLMDELDDGLQPLCIIGHTQFTDRELEGALPVIYPIKAGGIGTTDPDSEMIINAEQQFENGNVHLLCGNMNEGIAAYKKLHRMKTDDMDWKIAMPYKKTNELVVQIQNLREETGIKERRISNQIQRDTWSALKYALRLAQHLERKYLKKRKKKTDWDIAIAEMEKGSGFKGASAVKSRLVVARTGGRIR